MKNKKTRRRILKIINLILCILYIPIYYSVYQNPDSVLGQENIFKGLMFSGMLIGVIPIIVAFFVKLSFKEYTKYLLYSSGIIVFSMVLGFILQFLSNQIK